MLDEQGIQSYEGNYDDYQAELNRQLQDHLGDSPDKTRTELAKERRASRLLEEERQELQAAVKDAEAAVHQAEQVYNQALLDQADPDIYTNPDKAARQGALCLQLQSQVEQLFQHWAEAEQALHDFEQQYTSNVQNG